MSIRLRLLLSLLLTASVAFYFLSRWLRDDVKSRYFQILENGGYLYRSATKLVGDATEVQMTIACEGLQSFSLVPIAAATEVRLRSEWNDPGFFGDFLPLDYSISKEGFNASWKLTLPQGRKWNEVSVDGGTGAFGVAFYQPVDIYQASERSVKYAILFITLTLMALLLFEMVSSAEIHPMQYFLAGLGLVIFYLLLLALAEYLGFSLAYLIAAGANVALLSRYSASFLLSRSQSWTFTVVLAALYGLLYVILQLEEAALLSGAIALFAALAMAMYLTRKVNWYGLGEGAKS